MERNVDAATESGSTTASHGHQGADPLLSSIQFGALSLPNRIAMAPMTRSRADATGTPTPLMAEYYAQRAGAGLIITEGVVISPQGKGYPNTPGIFTEEQAARWSSIVASVHAAGGRIFAQLWHVGRASHPLLQPGGALPVAPSAIGAGGSLYTSEGMKPYPTPRALEIGEIPGIVDDFRAAAVLARQAGFDGVELHGANGYLIDQFLRNGSNRRTDGYGGSVENRARFLLEVAQAVREVYDADQVGVRISPILPVLGMHDSAPERTFGYVASALRDFQLAYLHVVETGSEGFDWGALRRAFGGRYLANGGYDHDRASAAIGADEVDLVSFGSPFIANPDLVERFRQRAPLQSGDRATYYTGGAAGYTDYPALGHDVGERELVGAGTPG